MGQERGAAMTVSGYGVSFWGKNVLRQDCADVCTPREYTKDS